MKSQNVVQESKKVISPIREGNSSHILLWKSLILQCDLEGWFELHHWTHSAPFTATCPADTSGQHPMFSSMPINRHFLFFLEVPSAVSYGLCYFNLGKTHWPFRNELQEATHKINRTIFHFYRWYKQENEDWVGFAHSWNPSGYSSSMEETLILHDKPP